MGDPKHVLGDWQHVPRFVTVVDPNGERRRADVYTHQRWSILVSEQSSVVRWHLMVFLPDGSRPLVFEDREGAERWAETADDAADLQWTRPSGAESPTGKTEAHHSLTLYSAYNGGGDHYEVPAPNGVADWRGKQPTDAGIPNWMPRSYETFEDNDRCNLYGHDHGTPQVEQHVYVVGVHSCNLPFAVLDSATSKY
jgi:hypothetical protein